MKTLVWSCLVGLLAVLPVAAQSPNAPRVCLASVDDKGNVIIRSFMAAPVTELPAQVAVDAGGGKKEMKTVKVSVRFSSEHIVTIGIKGIDAYVDGKEIDEKKLGELLEKEKPVLVATQMPTAAMQKVIKKGTLLLISPVSPEPQPVGVPHAE